MSTLRVSSSSLSSHRGRAEQLATLARTPAGLTARAWAAATPGGADERGFGGNLQQLIRLGDVVATTQGETVVYVVRGGRA